MLELKLGVCSIYFIPIYHGWEGYLRKIPVEKQTISGAEWRGKFSLKTGIFENTPPKHDISVKLNRILSRTLAK